MMAEQSKAARFIARAEFVYRVPGGTLAVKASDFW